MKKLIIGLFLMSTGLSWADISEFKVYPATIPLDEIQPGGPSKDGIPALTNPKFIPGNTAHFLKKTDRVIGVENNGKTKAYPIKILNWHEIVNDDEMVITYCPLCGTGMVFSSKVRGKKIIFGVSGLLYNSDVLMYDEESKSLWSQLKMEAVTGPMAGRKLTLLNSMVTTWDQWKKDNPNTEVLSIKTGHDRDYSFDPYEGYEESKSLYFKVKNQDNSRHPKDWVYGILVDGQARAYPFKELFKNNSPLNESLDDRNYKVSFNKQARSVQVLDESNKPIPGVAAYWFAWKAFYPKTTVYSSP